MPGTTLSRPVTRTLGRGVLRPFKALLSPSALAIDSVVSGISNNTGTGAVTTGTFIPTTADAIVLLGIRKGVTGALTGQPSVFTVGALTPTAIDVAEQTGQIGNCVVRAYLVHGLSPGVAVAATWAGNASQSVGKLVVFAFSLSNWQGNVGAHIAVTSHPASTTSGAVAAATPLVRKGSLILGMAYGSDFSVQPFSASGFVAQSSTRTSASGTTGAGTAFSKTGGAVGGTETLTPIAAGAWTDFGSILVEVY